MHSRKWGWWLLALGALLGASSAAMAQSVGRMYLFGSVGWADHSSSVTAFNAAYALAMPPTADVATVSDSGPAFKVGLGYQIHPNVALEGAWGSLGRNTYTVARPGAFGGTFENKIEPYAVQASAVGIFPINPNIEGFGRLGVAYIDNTGKVSQAGGLPAFPPCGAGIVCQAGTTESDWAAVLGLGLNFHLQARWFLRAEFEYYTKYRVSSVPDLRGALGPLAQAGGDIKIDTTVWSLGLGYRF